MTLGTQDPVSAPPLYSLVTGGAFFTALRRIGLAGPELEGARRRAFACVAVAWLVPLLLTIADGRAWGGAAVPFLRDIDMIARFLVAMPLFIVAEVTLHQRFPGAISRFIERGLVDAADRSRFDATLASARRWTESWAIEFAIVVIVIALNFSAVSRSLSALHTDTWYATLEQGQFLPRPAGIWVGHVSLPLLQFVILRWYSRLLIWWCLLWKLSRLELRLQPLHPDHAGGLGFLGQLCLGFVPLAMAQGAMGAGWIANQIFYAGAHLTQFKLDLSVTAIIVVFMFLGPLLAFGPALARAKRAGLGRYGNLAMQYSREFEQKWLRPDAPPLESPIGSGDIQSLADLSNSYALLQEMRVIPFNTGHVIRLGSAVLVPVAPLLLTMVSAEELLTRVVQFLL